ncbi:MAG: hypothetical protein ACI4IH_06835 [Eubacterium sp.]
MKERTLKTKLLTVLLTLCMVLSIVPITAFAAGVNYIDKISVTYNAPDYKAGDAPQAAAMVTEGNCSVAYEYWREIYQPEEGGVWHGTGRYWYSDADKMASLAADKQITQFEAGHSYSYNIVLKADSGYFISGDTTDISVGNYNWGTVDKTPNLEIKNMSTELHIHSPYSIDIPADDAPIAITLVDFGNVWKNLDSTKPVVFTTELNPNTDCPKQMEITDQAWVENDSSASISSNAYPEAGKEYVYEITLTAKEGYYFQTFYGTFDGKVIVDGVEKYSSGHGDAVPDVYDNGKTLKVKVYPAVIATNGTSQGDTTINNAYIENVKFDYRPGDAPQATAQVEDSSSDRYEVAYECWEEMENGEPVAFWYSDESKYIPSMKRITQFEDGKTYMYSIELKQKDGYTFADNCSVMINWSPISATANVVKTVDGLFAMNVETIRPQSTKEISVIEINNATLTFKDGDKPVFTGTVPENDQYAFRCEWWSLDENTGIVSTEPEWGGDIYTNKITAFEVGKTYHYGVYVTAYTADISPDAKLKINGREVEYTRIGDENDTQSFWVETDLSMTPTAADASNYRIVEGANGTWTQNSDGTLVFRANGDFSKFTGVKVDGTLIDAKNYTAVSGSTVITLKADYLKTLSVGTHKIAVVYTDGECSANFEVKKAASEQTKPTEGDKTDTTTPTGGKDTTSPQTGDNSNLALWFAVLFVSGAGVIGATVYSKKKRVR